MMILHVHKFKAFRQAGRAFHSIPFQHPFHRAGDTNVLCFITQLIAVNVSFYSFVINCSSVSANRVSIFRTGRKATEADCPPLESSSGRADMAPANIDARVAS